MVLLKLCFCILLLLILLVVAAKASLKLFLLTGTVSGKNGQRVSLVHKCGKGSEVLCSVTIQNNQFRLSCQVEQKGLVSLVFGEDGEQKTYPMLLKEGHFNFDGEGTERHKESGRHQQYSNINKTRLRKSG